MTQYALMVGFVPKIDLMKIDAFVHQDIPESNVKTVSILYDIIDKCYRVLLVHLILLYLLVFNNIQFTLGACSPSPCYNGGTCTIDDNGAPECRCPDGYDGDFCETSKSINDPIR